MFVAFRKSLAIPAIAIAAFTSLQSCSVTSTSQEQSAATQISLSPIGIDGSSTVFPITQAVVKEYGTKKPDVKINANFSGTGGGFKKFCAGQTDINDASRPILKKEIELCKQNNVRYYELPVAYDALSIVVNSQNTWAKDITVAELKQIWEAAAEGKINNWNQVRGTYPDRPLKLYGPGKASGTYDYFVETVLGKDSAPRTDYTVNTDYNLVAKGVGEDPNALGYFGISYFESNKSKLKLLAVDSGKGAVMPSRSTVENVMYQPLSRPLFIYVNAMSAEREHVNAFVNFYLAGAKRFVTSVGYIPLPDEGYRLSSLTFHKGEIGTVFEGVPQPNLTITALLRKQAK